MNVGDRVLVSFPRGDDTEKRLWLQLTKEKGASFRALRDFMYSATGIYVHRSDNA